MASIIGVLKAYNNQPVPSLPKGITLNAVISILATGSKSALLAAVASAIAQGKWTWFHSDDRPLEHAQILDEASRGPFGSIVMLFKRTAFSVPALGAIIMILSLGFDPFVQQILSTSIRQVPHASTAASTIQATAFLNPQELVMNQAINNAIYTDNFNRTPGCPTGNCTWPSFRSLGWCSKCADVTKLVRSNCSYSYDASQLNQSQHYFGSCNLALDQGYSTSLLWEVAPAGGGTFGLQVTTDVIWLVDDGNSTTTATFNNPKFLGVGAPQAVLGHVSMVFDDDSHPEKGFHVANATQCVLSFCARDYNVSVESGALSVSTSEPNFGGTYSTTYDNQSVACWTADPGSVAQMNYTNVTTTLSFPTQEGTIDYHDLVDPEHLTFCSPLTGLVARGLGLALGGFGGTIGLTIAGSSQSGVAFSEPGIQETDYFGATTGSSADVFTYLSQQGGLQGVMPRLADSLTSTALTLPNRTAIISGMVRSPEVFVEVRWEWISLPIFLCVSSAIFLAVTAFQTRISGVGLWKGSSLAYLYHGVEAPQAGFESFATASSMQSVAASTTVRLRFSERTARLGLL